MNLLIIEDEASIMDRLVRLSRSSLGNRIYHLETAANMAEARASMESDVRFDVLLLDLNIDGQDGFDLIKELATHSFQTIVVSANTQRAIEAYDLGVVDFVGKPFDQERLQLAFERAIGVNASTNHFAKFLAVRSGGRIELIGLDEIEYIEADGPCSVIQKSDGSKRTHNKMLKSIQKLLPNQFERVHKSYLVNMAAINGMRAGPDHLNLLTFPSGRSAPTSRSKTKELRSRLLAD